MQAALAAVLVLAPPPAATAPSSRRAVVGHPPVWIVYLMFENLEFRQRLGQPEAEARREVCGQ